MSKDRVDTTKGTNHPKWGNLQYDSSLETEEFSDDIPFSLQTTTPDSSRSWSVPDQTKTFREIEERKELYYGLVGEREIYSLSKVFNPLTDSIHKIKINGKQKDISIPTPSGIAFGLLSAKGELKGAPIKDMKLFEEILLKCGEIMGCPRLTKKPFLPHKKLPPLEDCTDVTWWPKEVIELSENSISLTTALLTLEEREKTEPHFWFFSGSIPNRREIENWNAEMIITQLKTYVFCPFVFEYFDYNGNKRHMIAQFNIPAFSKEQAKIIMKKRLLEFRNPLNRGTPLYSKEELRENGYKDPFIDKLHNKTGIVIKAPNLDSIPILGIEDTSIIDFFPIDEETTQYSDSILSGQLTSDDLGFLFSILFSKELGLIVSTPQEGNSYFDKATTVM